MTAEDSLPSPSSGLTGSNGARANLSIGSALRDRGIPLASRLVKDIAQRVDGDSVEGYGHPAKLLGGQLADVGNSDLAPKVVAILDGNEARQYGLQYQIGTRKSCDTGPHHAKTHRDSMAKIERAARDITLGILETQTAYADSSPAKIYLHSPSLDRATVLERQHDSKGKPFWSVVTSMPSTREQMMRRFKAPTSVFGTHLNGERSQQTLETQREVLKKLREPGRPQFSAESLILSESQLFFHRNFAGSSNKVNEAFRKVLQAPDTLALRRAVDGASMSRREAKGGFYLWCGLMMNQSSGSTTGPRRSCCSGANGRGLRHRSRGGSRILERR